MPDPFKVWSDITGIFSGVADTAHAIAAVGDAFATFFSYVTDPYMWKSLGWLVLGFFILLGGIIFFIRHPIEEAVGTAVGAAVKAP